MIFAGDREYEHFLELLEEMSERYAVEVHAYALMSNHYHVLIRTPDGNASKAIQWLNVSYSVWFNRRRERVGHVFQGRFGSVLIEGKGSWALNASVYVHLNPIRTAEYGLGKRENKAEGRGFVAPDRKEIMERLKALREYKWSTYGAYAGYRKAAGWLKTEELLKRAGGIEKYRRYAQMHVTRGMEPEGYEDMAGRVMLGTREFQEKAREWVGRLTKEQPGRKQLEGTVTLGAIVKLVEGKRSEKWSEFSERHGDWGRELVLYLARKRSGLTLREIGEGLGLKEYKTVGKAVERFEARLAADRNRRRVVKTLLNELSNVET